MTVGMAELAPNPTASADHCNRYASFPARPRRGKLCGVVDSRFEPHDSTVLPVSEGRQTQAYATLVSAFFEDPVERWLYPAPQEYRTHFPEFLAAFGGKAFQHDTVWTLGEFSAVALWLPSGIEPDGDAITAVLAETVDPSKHDDLFSVLEQMDAAHPRTRTGTSRGLVSPPTGKDEDWAAR